MSEIMSLKQELEEAKTSYVSMEDFEQENKTDETEADLQKETEDLNFLLEDSKIQIRKLKKKELHYQSFIDSQFTLLQDLKRDLDSVKEEFLQKSKLYSFEFQKLGLGLQELVDAAENYHIVFSENRRLYNEVQDLKGNIRVYCRIRPFLPGESEAQTTIDYIGENGELVVTNPLKQGKETRRPFKFNKVFAQTATQEEVFKDTQPLIRSVLDGYNVCIFAYGQTGSGKTYTMSGPDASSEKDWGVNYRALHDLFHISQSRKTSISYEVGVQMVEIYNEQVRDLLASDGPHKKLGIWSCSHPNGLAVPEASLHPVQSTNDVMELMNFGLMNRAVGATALNERSSRSHSIVSVHVRGTDIKSNSALRGCLHLVDLAGSERVDRTEVTGDRLREAQHINKSLSSLGDVIFALSQKNAHVPYRNSKLTQVLQSSLGGQAKTLMFVQLNPDIESYNETISTLKFAERVSGVELGAARSNKEGKDIRELMEQVSSMKEAIQRKDEEIERLRSIKANASVHRRSLSAIRGSTSSQSSCSPRSQSEQPTRRRTAATTSYQDHCSQLGWKRAQASPQQSRPGHENRTGPKSNDDVDLIGFGEADSEERLSDISDSGLSMGTETDGSMGSLVEFTLFPEASNSPQINDKPSLPSRLPKPPVKQDIGNSSQSGTPKSSIKGVPTSKKPPTVNSLSATKPKSKPVAARRWQ